MTKSKFTSVLKLFVFFLIFTLTANQLFAQLNTNGSFEEATLGIVAADSIDGWVIEVSTAIDPAPVIEIIDSIAQNGKNSLRAAITSVGSNQWDIQVIADSIPVVPGETYLYSVWAKSESAGVQVNFTTGNYDYNEYGVIRPATLTTAWQKYSFQFTISDQEVFARAPIHMSLAASQNSIIYLDNLKIQKLVDQIEASKPIIVEAELGDVGSDFAVMQDDTINYVSIQTDASDFDPAVMEFPGFQARTISFEVTFPDTGEYNLFAKIRVGSGQWDDDSFLYGNGFGIKDSSNADDWIVVNGLQNSGFNEPSAYVFEPGALADGVWKWINISQNLFHVQGISYKVVEDSLTTIFQIGGRETGFDIDKFAFAKANLFYTVENLEMIEPGVDEIPSGAWTGPPLANDKPKFLGSAYSSTQAPDFEFYWNQITPENASKWGSVEGTRDVMNWGGLDEAYNFAKVNGFQFRFHVLIWGNQQPNWIESLSTEEQLEEIREWFEAVAERYPDIDYIEVVNEPLHDPPSGATNGNYIEALGGSGTSGWDWVLNAFRMAREIFPASTKLLINEYGILGSSSTVTNYIKIIELLKAENLIDGIGAQGHAFSTNVPASVIINNLTSLGATGLDIQITELDIDGPNDQVQLTNYQKIIPAVWEHPSVEGVTLWGWKPGLWRNAQAAYIIDLTGNERPAMVWLRDYIQNYVVGVSESSEEIPSDFELYSNYPNPFNPTTQIKFSIPQSTYVSLKVYNSLGEEVANLFEGYKNAGTFITTFDASNLASGIYIYQIIASNFVQSKKLVLMK